MLSGLYFTYTVMDNDCIVKLHALASVESIYTRAFVLCRRQFTITIYSLGRLSSSPQSGNLRTCLSACQLAWPRIRLASHKGAHWAPTGELYSIARTASEKSTTRREAEGKSNTPRRDKFLSPAETCCCRLTALLAKLGFKEREVLRFFAVIVRTQVRHYLLENLMVFRGSSRQ